MTSRFSKAGAATFPTSFRSTAWGTIDLQTLRRAVTFEGVQMTKTFFALASHMALPSFAGAEDWKAIRIRDRDYIDFTSLARFFRFPRDTKISRIVLSETRAASAAPIQQPGAAIRGSA